MLLRQQPNNPMLKRTDHYFRYPPNLNMLDLATLVNLYRSRGEPIKAKSGEYFGCAVTFKLIREAKMWFGLYYSQTGWDLLLSKGASGYPITEIEMNVLGLATGESEYPTERSFIEKNAGGTQQLTFMVINDLKTFGFLNEDQLTRLTVTPAGEEALHGFTKKLFEKKFIPDMLYINEKKFIQPTIQVAAKKDKDSPQIDMF